MKTITKFSLIAALVCGATVANAQVPSYPAPTPEQPAEDVAIIFADTYGEANLPDEGVTEWGPFAKWAYSATADESQGLLVITDMDVKQPADVTETLYEWCAIKFPKAIQTKSFTYFHVDVFCNEETDFRVGFQTFYPTVLELYFPVIERGTMTPGKWYSIDFPITDLKYTQAENSETPDWGTSDATMIRLGNGPDLFDYSGEIYLTNMYFFNGEAKYLGGKVIEPEGSGIAAIENNYGFNSFVSGNTLNSRADEAIKTINMYSVTGQVVKSIEVNDMTSSINIADLTAGIYVVSAELANGQVASARIIK